MNKKYCFNGSRMQARLLVGLSVVIVLALLFITYGIKDCEQIDLLVNVASKGTKYSHLPYNVTRDSRFDFRKEMEKLNKERVKADDPRLVNLIRNYYIEPPSDKPYKLLEPGRRDASYGQAMFVDGTLRNMEGGFFVDSGAHDGEIQSNTLFFERIRGWTGILIEPQPQIYKQLKDKHRKSFTLNACVSVVPYPSTVKFLPTSFYGKMVENLTSEAEWRN